MIILTNLITGQYNVKPLKEMREKPLPTLEAGRSCKLIPVWKAFYQEAVAFHRGSEATILSDQSDPGWKLFA